MKIYLNFIFIIVKLINNLDCKIYMYQVGKYKYKSKEQYQKILIGAFVIFFISSLILLYLRDNMNFYLYKFTYYLSLVMMLHLFFRYSKSKDWIENYVFNEY